MNKKILALIILLIVIVGGYGMFYTAVTTLLMPQDLDNFEIQLYAMPQLPVINDSTITELESAANITENYSALSYLTQSERAILADQIKNNNSGGIELLKQNFTEYNNYIDYRALEYNLILRRDLSSGIKNLSTTYTELSSFSIKADALSQKMAEDFRKGDNKAYADDLRALAYLMRQYNSEMVLLKTQIQYMIDQLSK